MDHYPLDIVFTNHPRSDGHPESVDRLLSALAKEPRRLVVSYFEESETETASLDDLAEYIAHRDGPDSSTPERVRLHLYHVDVPTLATAGLVDYDARSETVRYQGPPASVDRDAWARLVIPGTEAT